MGGFTSAIAPLVTVGKSISPVVSFATQLARMTQRNSAESKANRLEEAQYKKRIDAERQVSTAQQESYDRNRLLGLNRALARQKANFASQGLSSNDTGSVETVLQSIVDDSENDSADRKRIEALRLRADELAMQQGRARNLLEESSNRRRNQLSLISGLFS